MNKPDAVDLRSERRLYYGPNLFGLVPYNHVNISRFERQRCTTDM
jgi:hypothetical protein